MNFPIHEGCHIPDATQFRRSDRKWTFFNLDSRTPIPVAGERPPHCKECIKCIPTVVRGKSIGLSTYEITPETVNK